MSQAQWDDTMFLRIAVKSSQAPTRMVGYESRIYLNTTARALKTTTTLASGSDCCSNASSDFGGAASFKFPVMQSWISERVPAPFRLGVLWTRGWKFEVRNPRLGQEGPARKMAHRGKGKLLKGVAIFLYSHDLEAQIQESGRAPKRSPPCKGPATLAVGGWQTMQSSPLNKNLIWFLPNHAQFKKFFVISIMHKQQTLHHAGGTVTGWELLAWSQRLIFFWTHQTKEENVHVLSVYPSKMFFMIPPSWAGRELWLNPTQHQAATTTAAHHSGVGSRISGRPFRDSTLETLSTILKLSQSPQQ